MKAVVLAGGRSKGALYQSTGVANKAMTTIGGRPMVEYVIEALQKSRSVDGIVLVGAPEAAWAGVEAVLPDSGSLPGNVVQGAAAFPDEEFLLYATADIPLLTPAAVDDFAVRVQEIEADIIYPIVSRRVSEESFPGQKRTYVRLREGTFTGGNITAMRRSFVDREQALMEQVFALRKQPLKLAGLMGFGLVLRLLLGLVGLDEVERAAGRLINGRARALPTAYAEIAFDVDKPSDLEAVRCKLPAADNS